MGWRGCSFVRWPEGAGSQVGWKYSEAPFRWKGASWLPRIRGRTRLESATASGGAGVSAPGE